MGGPQAAFLLIARKYFSPFFPQLPIRACCVNIKKVLIRGQGVHGKRASLCCEPFFLEVKRLRKNIHPEYVETKVSCSCGETFMTRSTKPELKVELCSKCHPFYTGKQKLVDSGGRVQRFQKKYGLEPAGTGTKEEAKEEVEAK
jgi:large subunit ribosomal protein L31